jgi:hypothetical protein
MKGLRRIFAVSALSLLAITGILAIRQGNKPAPVVNPPPAITTTAQPHFGYLPQPEATKKFVASLAKPTLVQANPLLLRAEAADKKPVLLYRSLYKAYAANNGGKQWTVGAQGIGDCVSWGWAHAADIHLAVMWELGDSAEWSPAATEAIYGGSRVEAIGATRGGWSDGSYGGAAAKWVSKWGVVFRRPYDTADLTVYDSRRAKDWGNYGCGGQGDNGLLDKIAQEHPIKHVVLVRNFEEAAAAIASGYPVAVCSGQGFSSARDKDGFAAARGSWAHCMCFIGVRYEPKPGLLCLNSWGPRWIEGPKWPEDQPDGSFWVDADVATRMLRGEDSFAVSGYEGFPYRDLKHGDWAVIERPSGVLVASIKQGGGDP